MKISDEQLSAFLDAELPEQEMEFIRQQLSDDETLANRLAELAMVDEQIASHYAGIDQQPMPEAITQLLRDEQSVTNNIIQFPLWKKMHHKLQQHAAMAASVALVIGFSAAQLLPGSNNADNWNAIAQVLDNASSGTEQIITDGSRIKPRLSFINQEGDYCRQFLVVDKNISAENIACRTNNRWQLTMSIYSQQQAQPGEYQTATGGSVLDSALDEMMQSDAFDAEAENRAIKNRWQPD